jgi:5-(carboxyamino)imidazole ribonucleotide synthase
MAESNSLYGCFGIEFFETAEGQLLVNEIAPRVHNTGHYTQDACATSQFENHWRAVVGMPLGDIQPAAGFAMQNLLGPKDVQLTRDEARLPSLNERLHLHWYDKKDIVPKRKLGHINATATNAADVPGLLNDLENAKTAWHANLQAIQREKNRAE